MQWRLGRRPALDGIRAAAVIGVMGAHADTFGFAGGGYGVDVFFVLSGFLITSILVEELDDIGRIELPMFWLRRALRLIPALVVVVGICWIFADRLIGDTRAAALPALFYYSNWIRAAGGDTAALGHTWSLAIEEQFYIVWPVLLLGLWRVGGMRAALRFASVAACVVLAARVFGDFTEPRLYNDFFLKSDALLIGCALALFVHLHGVGWFRQPRLAALCLLVFGGALLRVELTPRIYGTNWLAWASFERFALCLATAGLIGALMAGNAPTIERWATHPIAAWIGVRSYGIYLWHYPIMRTLRPLDVVWTIGLSFLAAGLSYRFVESPFLRLKDRFSGRRPVPVELRVEVVGQQRPFARGGGRCEHDYVGNIAIEEHRWCGAGQVADRGPVHCERVARVAPGGAGVDVDDLDVGAGRPTEVGGDDQIERVGAAVLGVDDSVDAGGVGQCELHIVGRVDVEQ